MVGVCKLVRGKDLAVAKAILIQTSKKGARIIEKALKSAVANAKNKNMDEKNIYISKIFADMGPSLKRSIAWSRGTALPIKKRMTHLTIVLEEKEAIPKVKAKEDEKIKEEKKISIKAVAEEKETKKETPDKKVKKDKVGKAKVTVKKKEE